METTAKISHAHGFSGGFLVKLILMGMVNAFGLYGIVAASGVGSWGVTLFLVLTLIAVNIIYFLPERRILPAKYMFPGLIFLLVFQIFVILYTGYTALTNYGDGHSGTKEAAIEHLERAHEQRVEGSPQYAVTVLRDGGGELALAIVQDDRVLVGGNDQPLKSVDSAEIFDRSVRAVNGYDVLEYPQVVAVSEQLAELRVPRSEDAHDEFLRTTDGRKAFVYTPTIHYDKNRDAMVEDDGTAWVDQGKGAFVGPSGEELRPGWQVFVGFENFGSVFDPKVLGGSFLSVTIWTFVFAFMSVALSFFVGLFLAIMFNDRNLKGRNIYRAIIFLPYAFPVFLSALIWAGLLNTDYGWVNQVLLNQNLVPWLDDPWLARLSVILVNLWLGFPYMFLITTGALQSIPDEIYESAAMDGAGPFRRFRSITLPMLMVAVGPLLIASFAMNFNNFNVIYLVTKGGPQNIESTTGVGSTDILISFVYKIAFSGGANDYGLAAALSILIFVMIAIASVLTFRRSRALEEIA